MCIYPTNSNSCTQSFYNFHNRGVEYLGKNFQVLAITSVDNCLQKILKCMTLPLTSIAHLFGVLYERGTGKQCAVDPIQVSSSPGSASSLRKRMCRRLHQISPANQLKKIHWTRKKKDVAPKDIAPKITKQKKI